MQKLVIVKNPLANPREHGFEPSCFRDEAVSNIKDMHHGTEANQPDVTIKPKAD